MRHTCELEGQVVASATGTSSTWEGYFMALSLHYDYVCTFLQFNIAEHGDALQES